MAATTCRTLSQNVSVGSDAWAHALARQVAVNEIVLVAVRRARLAAYQRARKVEQPHQLGCANALAQWPEQ